jgi:hypothetical protein
MISRRVHGLSPDAIAWLNDLLPSLAREYGPRADEITSEPNPTPGVSVRVANKGLMLDPAPKSGKYRTNAEEVGGQKALGGRSNSVEKSTD